MDFANPVAEHCPPQMHVGQLLLRGLVREDFGCRRAPRAGPMNAGATMPALAPRQGEGTGDLKVFEHYFAIPC